ncbi:MAG TPA: YciC family protein [Allosphingosinicella sp.]|jgi:uncharacterized membrane protein
MKFSMSAVWDDTRQMLAANASLVAAVAGVFLFLPTLAFGYFVPEPTGGRDGPTLEMLMQHMRANWPLLLLVNLIGLIGNLALFILTLDRDDPTVGGAIKAAALLLPVYFLTSFLSGLVIFVGLVLFIVPGLYLMARLAVAGPAIVAERLRNPVDALRRSVAVTKGNGWAILALLLVLILAYFVLSLAGVYVLGSIFLLIGRAAGAEGLGEMLLLIFSTALGAAFYTVLMVLLASLYRRLAEASGPTSGI